MFHFDSNLSRYLLAFSTASGSDLLIEGRRIPQLSTSSSYDVQDALLKVKEGVSVSDLSRWSRDGKTNLLEKLFSEYAVSMKCLPTGVSAGKAGQVLSQQLGPVPAKALTFLAEASWYGKEFEASSNDCTVGRGVNRIYGLHYVHFVTRVIDNHELAPSRANVVELNYAEPGFGIIPGLVKSIGVYDLMVAIPGKYGPIYVGKTWFGKYQKATEPGSFQSNTVRTNWYFLDFNAAALAEMAKADKK